MAYHAYCKKRRGAKPVRSGRVSLLLVLTMVLLSVHGARAGQVQRALDADQPSVRYAEPRTPGGAPQRRVEINIPTTTLFLYEGDRLLRAYRVAVGRPWTRLGEVTRKTETPTGDFVITHKVQDPFWYPPAWFRKEKGWPPDYRVPSGPGNPLGSRWLSFWRPGAEGYGIHGTIDPDAIGTAVSLGCVRMLNRDVEELFDLVAGGTPVRVTYEPALVYRDGDGRWHLAVGPDLYRRGHDLSTLASQELRRYGLDESVLEGEPLADLAAPRDLVLVQAPAGIRIRWLVGAPWNQDGFWEDGSILVAFEGLPPVLHKYFQPEPEARMLLYGRPLAGVFVREDEIYLRLGEVAPRFGLTVEVRPGGEEAVVHF